MGFNSTDRSEKLSLITRYASGLVRNHNSKFGIYFNSNKYAINSISIDEDDVLHGWHVKMVTHRGGSANNGGLNEFAKNMQGVMKVHQVMIRVMQDPIITDLN